MTVWLLVSEVGRHSAVIRYFSSLREEQEPPEEKGSSLGPILLLNSLEVLATLSEKLKLSMIGEKPYHVTGLAFHSREAQITRPRFLRNHP